MKLSSSIAKDRDSVLRRTDNCVSIVYRVSSESAASFTEGIGGIKTRGAHRFDTLDLVVPKDRDFETLVNALEDLVALYREEIKKYDRELLFLRFHWVDMDKELDQRLSLSEWTNLCGRVCCPLKKAHVVAYYKDFVKEKDVEEVGLNLDQTMELLDEIRYAAYEAANMDEEEDPLNRVWREVSETDPVPPIEYGGEDKKVELELALNLREESISAVALLSFIRSQQKEYKTSIEKVYDLITLLNSQLSPDERPQPTTPVERLKKSRFMAYLLSDANDIMDPTKGTPGFCDMTKPLSWYWINASHDTYLAKIPNAFLPSEKHMQPPETVDTQMYMHALIRGVRFVEADCWDGPDGGGPVVARREPTSTGTHYVPFDTVLQVLHCFLKANPYAYPIILSIENHCSLTNQDIMAEQLKTVLGKAGLLYVPTSAMLLDSATLPSPEELRGKVVIRGKRPKFIKEGATVMNDDYDDENDDVAAADYSGFQQGADDEDDDDEEIHGIVVGFEPAGPIKSNDPQAVVRSPLELLEEAEVEAATAASEAAAANARAEELRVDAVAAETYASRISGEAGLSAAQVKNRAVEEKHVTLDEEEGTELDLATYTRSLTSEDPLVLPSPSEPSCSEEGIEVQDFFGDAVEGARSRFSVADANALEASVAAAGALDKLNDAEEALTQAQRDLEDSYQRERRATSAASKAAADARSNREHADTARQRVNTVKDLLRNSRNSATSAETVVVTAMTEAKISEQRAAETEARASRALASAQKDRARADDETNKEEVLELETSQLHDHCGVLTKEAKSARERMEKAASMLDRVNEQIKLIESSSQFVREMREQNYQFLNGENNGSLTPGRPKIGGKFIEKHAVKLDEREMCTKLIKEASNEHTTAELKRRRAQALFEEKAHEWKIQADVASAARKQADRTSQHAEDLAEQAEEEREAASLRHIARERAQQGVELSDTHRASVQAQLAEASRASEVAASLALESRQKAERLAREAEKAKDHRRAIANVEEKRRKRDAAQSGYEVALEKKADADEVQKEAKRLMETSSEVYTNAKRDAAAEIQKANAERMMEKSAVQAYGKAILCRKQAEHAAALATMATQTSEEKTAAVHHAREYKRRKDRIQRVSVELAKLTLLNSLSFKHWGKSHSLPQTCMHSIYEGRFLKMIEDEEDGHGTSNDFVSFTVNHLLRTFPSWKGKDYVINFDPTTEHAFGCQIVSMNLHSSDEHLLVNDGRFRENGSCGYVLKPPELSALHLDDDDSVNVREQRWRVSILSGSCLPRNEGALGRKPLSVGGSLNYISPFVQVSLYEGDLRQDNVLHTTNAAVNNGLNPVWDEEEDEFEFVVRNPTVAVVLFSVWDDDTGDFVAASPVPLSCVREGYRSIALFDSMHSRSGPYAFSSLFVRVQKLST